MEPLEIKKYPDPVLRKRCKFVEGITSREKELLESMLFTMRSFKGIGLAAPQIGINQRLIVGDIGEGVLKLANPEIIKVKGSDKMAEGCLSIPDVSIEVKRPFEIEIVGLNEKGEIREIKARGLLARVLQHEIDHLNGKLIIDYGSLLQRIKLFGFRRKRN